VTSQLGQSRGPVVAVSDWMRSVPDQISRWVPRRYMSLGTDGFGRSDTREALRRFFETDAASVVLTVLSELVAEGALVPAALDDAIARYGVATDGPAPWLG
jgi:pyruvate dehydrogenase E1 component